MMHIYSLALEERKTAAHSFAKSGERNSLTWQPFSYLYHVSILLSSCKEDEVLALNMQ